MRFDELVLKIPGDELHVRFHPRLTVLCGLGLLERQALVGSVLGALAGGDDTAALRYVDGTGRAIEVIAEAGVARARYADDGSPAPVPLETIAPSIDSLRDLMLVHSNDLGVVNRPASQDEPAELREARVALSTISEELETALSTAHRTGELRAELEELETALRVARDGAARREYAQILAQLERVRAEGAALQSGSAGADADGHLLTNASEVGELATRWANAAEALHEARRLVDGERLPEDALAAAAAIPAEAPEHFDSLLQRLLAAQAERDHLSQRLQVLAVSKLPAPSDLLVGELGLLEPHDLWATAAQLVQAMETHDQVQVALGGIGHAGPAGAEPTAGPAVIDAIEEAHRDAEEADQAVDASRGPALAGTGVGAALAALALVVQPLLVPVGVAVAVGAAIVGLARPKARQARAAAREREVLDRAGVTSYLAFHLRRVDATVDPHRRDEIDVSDRALQSARGAWVDLVGHSVDVHRAMELRSEVEEYHDALRDLGGAADEIEHLRLELTERAEPALARVADLVAEVIRPYGLAADIVAEPARVAPALDEQIHLGHRARTQMQLEEVEADEEKAATRLDDLLLQLGFDSGALDARIGAVEWAISRAREREDARVRARPRAEIEAELVQLQDAASQLRRPEWATVTAADAATPDVTELESRREQVAAALAQEAAAPDVPRLADRQAAMERRVAALDARHGGHDANGDPGAVADIQQHLLAHLTTAAQAGPQGDAVPVMLDEAFIRVPAERKWDLLDLLHRLSERHQLIYLSDDAFVAAWARQRAGDGDITLLEPAPESS